MGRLLFSGRERIVRVAPLIFLYGPPGSGKSTVGRYLAEALALDFFDLDTVVENKAGSEIPAIFTAEGESGFRARESEALKTVLANGSGVVALGGGTLLDTENQDLVREAGSVLCLDGPAETLMVRLSESNEVRPLLEGDRDVQLKSLLEERAEHYASFPLRLDTHGLTPAQTAFAAQVKLGKFRIRGMGSDYDVVVDEGGLSQVGAWMADHDLRGTVALVTDETVGALYAAQVSAAVRSSGMQIHSYQIPPGEDQKTLSTAADLWDFFARSRMERSSVVLALGGGVVGDLAGFAAANFMRGIAWIYLPTTLLAMVDASVGGKTGVNLPRGKNLVGAFHAPRAVRMDIATLKTLPEIEIANGLAEVVKHGIIADPALFDLCERGIQVIWQEMDTLISRAVAVKLRVIQEDPYEAGLRETLNLGHTIGHAVEQASNYRIRHGAAVAIGMVVEARLSRTLGIAADNLEERLSAVLSGVGLPVDIPDLINRSDLIEAMMMDKKRAGDKLRFSLPVKVGEVRTGIEVAPEDVQRVLG